ncbi:hypothetical protein E2C01_049119 [Portunus trituberculatus]|uniref:Uncharacterized protein n=1 Tax=Portunus trituberculatus TaxID=210409 RepID=A0A5B7GDC9_PORTR|nr:hypothetical protein [Portunus trituberculatus]
MEVGGSEEEEEEKKEEEEEEEEEEGAVRYFPRHSGSGAMSGFPTVKVLSCSSPSFLFKSLRPPLLLVPRPLLLFFSSPPDSPSFCSALPAAVPFYFPFVHYKDLSLRWSHAYPSTSSPCAHRRFTQGR